MSSARGLAIVAAKRFGRGVGTVVVSAPASGTVFADMPDGLGSSAVLVVCSGDGRGSTTPVHDRQVARRPGEGDVQSPEADWVVARYQLRFDDDGCIELQPLRSRRRYEIDRLAELPLGRVGEGNTGGPSLAPAARSGPRWASAARGPSRRQCRRVLVRLSGQGPDPFSSSVRVAGRGVAARLVSCWILRWAVCDIAVEMVAA
jgi:hypothetical protein